MNDQNKHWVLWGILLGIVAAWLYDRWGKAYLDSLFGGDGRRVDYGVRTTEGYGAPDTGMYAAAGSGSGCAPKCGCGG